VVPTVLERVVAGLTLGLETLASEIGERHVFRPGALRDAAAFIEQKWRTQGYQVRAQRYEVHGVACANREVTCRGPGRPDEIILVGAHYDSVPGSPGADDNASGVAALLEISRAVPGAAPLRSVRCVAFVKRGAAVLPDRRHGEPALRAGGARGRGRHPPHAVAGDDRLLQPPLYLTENSDLHLLLTSEMSAWF